MPTKFEEQLVLAKWALKQLGITVFSQLTTMLRAPEFEGWAEDGGTRFVQQLIARLPGEDAGRTVSNEMLRDYDNNIVSHWKHITEKRNLQGHTLYPLYFQYLSLLLTEMYLDRYFHDRAALLESLNELLRGMLAPAAAQLPLVGARRAKARTEPEIPAFTEGDLNKVAFLMATGSGKTLLMHCHIRQYLHYRNKCGERQELNRIILLTPNEGLSRQHRDEFELSGIPAELYDREGGTLFSGRGVDIIDIHKLKETSGEKTVAVDTFEGNNLVLVDEGHRGAGGEDWMDKRARLCANGFSFEYSATFIQAINALTGAKQKALAQLYQKCILFDYSYKYFYDDGYGKDFNILNLAEEHEDETRPLYLTACMLAFYQQCKRFGDGGAALLPYLLESPLMVFVGGSVTGQRQSQEDTDLVLILTFLAEFVGKPIETERRLRRLLERQDGLIANGQRVFLGLFPYVETQWRPEQAGELFKDILRLVFNAPGGGLLHIVRLVGSEGEIGLRVGENPWFGVVNVGDAKELCDLCKERREAGDNYVVDELSFSDSLFRDINRDESSIRMLAGAKKFTEGWSSWRVSAMGLMNVGKKEGSEIIQLFGRGVRLKGYHYKLKRTAALDAMDLQSETVSLKHPDYIELLETLNIFGVKSDYMEDFKEYLEDEGVGEEERREVVFLPTIKLPEFQKEELKLNIVRPQLDMPEFKATERHRLVSLDGELDNKVIADWYPRLQKKSSVSAANGRLQVPNQEPLRQCHLAFLDWNTIWFEVERHKREQAFYNIVFSPEDLRAIMAQTWWYELFIPPGYLDFRFDRLPLWQEIATHLLKGYLERFYRYRKHKYEAPFLEYRVLRPDDDLVLQRYQFLIKKSEKELIKRLRELGAKFEAGDFEEFNFENLQIFRADHHLYEPLVHLTHGVAGEALIKVVPTHLNEGEKFFVDDLEKYCKSEANGKLAGVDVYLLRNHNSDKAISFFTGSGFRPDFILWLLHHACQTVAFIDPKGLGRETASFGGGKIAFSGKIKQIQANLEKKTGRSDIRLEAYIVSRTSRNDLRWPSPHDPTRQATAAEYLEHHILCAKDEPDTYVRDMFGLLI